MSKDKKEGKSFKTVIADIFSNIFHAGIDDLKYNIKDKIKRTKENIIAGLFSSILILIALVFLAISFTNFLVEYQHYNKTTAFLITSGVLFLFAFIVRYRSLKNKKVR